MARKPKAKAAEPQETSPEQDDTFRVWEDAVDEFEAIDIATETLTGDLRDFVLDRLKHEQNKQPWHLRSEADQRDTVHQVEAAVQRAVRRAVELIAGEGKRSVRATLEQVTIKDCIKATLTLSKFDEERHRLCDATGAKVLIIVADPEDFTGERAPVEIRPDQSVLLGDAMAVHADTDRPSRKAPRAGSTLTSHSNGATENPLN